MINFRTTSVATALVVFLTSFTRQGTVNMLSKFI